MIKFTTFDLHDSNGTYIDFHNPEQLIKTAEYSGELKDRLTQLEKKADRTYILVNAMGSGEFWGSNRNGDYFPDAPLSRDHKTFEKLGHAFKHHINKDPETAYGQVKIAVFNPDMHRVELVIELDNQRAKDILERIEHGEYPAVSMGVKVPYDVCSICGKKSKRVVDYCTHLKYEMGKTYDDGKKVYAINDTDLKFFDISFVRIPADRTASVLSKIASTNAQIPSAVFAQEILKLAGIKESAINKVLDGTVDASSPDPKRLIYASQADMPAEELSEVLSKHELKTILSTLLGLRIVPKPMDFQRIILIKINKPELAKEAQSLMDLSEEAIIPDDLNLDSFSDELAEKIAHWCPDMSLTKPHIIRRVIEKRAELAVEAQPIIPEPNILPTKNPLMPLLGLGALYIGYNSLMDNLGFGKAIGMNNKFEQFLLSKPWLIPIVLGAAAAGTVGAQHEMNKTGAANFLTRMLVAVPSSYMYAGYQESKVQKGVPVTEYGDFVRRHPFLTGVAGTVALGAAHKLYKKSPLGLLKKSEFIDPISRLALGLDPEKFEQFYNDVIDN